jgi:hypothetical protein
MWILDASRLQNAQVRIRENNAQLQNPLQILRDEAEQAKVRPFRTVLDKEYSPPSGDKHDYLSFGPYWWPNPDTPDGLPYVRRDGHLNPDTAVSDKQALEGLMRDVETLALAYFYTRDESLAQAAALRSRAWFLDPATRMNPHLEYGQAIPGVCAGRGIGIIDTVALRLLPDVLVMLQDSDAWTKEENTRLREWMARYLDWLLTSRHGLEEEKQHNNHGTWYDVQVTLLALATGRDKVAQEVLQHALDKRFARHIALDGSQPHELARTRSFSYSCYNLTGLFDLASLGEKVGMDLWSWQGESGASLQRALQFLASYADVNNAWPHPQVVTDDASQLLALLRRAAAHFPQHDWTAAIQNAEQRSAKAAQLQLMWPL